MSALERPVGAPVVALLVSTVLAGCFGGPTREEPTPTEALPDGYVLTERDSPATWVLLEPSDVTAESVSFAILASRVECASGVTGDISEVRVQEDADRVIVTVIAAPDGNDDESCQGNDWVPATFELEQPLGSRILEDGLCYTAKYQRTADCRNGPERYPNNTDQPDAFPSRE